jgi:signal transduction histidine kinase
VQDHGPGIPHAMVPRLFSRFYRGDAGGAGLGLYISREIVAAHGGTIEVESEEGRGATFTVRLPLIQ